MAAIDPDLALDLAKATAEAYEQATDELIAIVARHTRAGTGDPDGWAARKLAELHTLRREAQQVVDRMGGETPGLVDRAVRSAYQAGGGLPLATHTRAVDAMVSEAVSRVVSTHTQILRSVVDDYRAVITRTSTLVATGAFTVDQAARAALRDFADRGVTGFVDSAGRRWRLDRYAEMATRTAVGRAQVAGTLDRLVGDGRDLVVVSDHHGACAVCAPFEGRVLSISGATSGTVETGDGRTVQILGSVSWAHSQGLQHPNCRHSMAAFTPGLSTLPEPRGTPTDGVERRRAANIEAERIRRARRRQAARTGQAPTRPAPLVAPSDRVSLLPGARTATGIAAREALEAIGKVHRIPATFFPVEVVNSRAHSWFGEYSAMTRRIRISEHGDHMSATMAHEFGHYIDNAWADTRTVWNTRTDPALAAWREAIEATPSVQKLRSKRRIRGVAYYLSDVELWARSYAQWIAVRSGNATMIRDLLAIRSVEDPARKLSQWGPDEFRPVADVLDSLFRTKGLR